MLKLQIMHRPIRDGSQVRYFKSETNLEDVRVDITHQTHKGFWLHVLNFNNSTVGILILTGHQEHFPELFTSLLKKNLTKYANKYRVRSDFRTL